MIERLMYMKTQAERCAEVAQFLSSNNALVTYEQLAHGLVEHILGGHVDVAWQDEDEGAFFCKFNKGGMDYAFSLRYGDRESFGDIQKLRSDPEADRVELYTHILLKMLTAVERLP